MNKLTMPDPHARGGVPRLSDITTLVNTICGREVRP
ncbi:hypothetical protein GGE16_004922 [Rhizobium leguminosarum]|uniref:Uncharacterized protein n=1 Tax=Rhizobium leguminosarum TaxID=384 RepID=A0AAE2SYC1_RHILE|nr:hypothetical protein [Rhizobium leguminosarum]MBB4434883.1 hypothetical protein [Rhizobium esperanzae]MBB4299122.1 hypothetical protein [Rhizobium leguminosarum]MBB4310621.1 hypothetical protein [Rhizobium leguminosarum]MBB4419737.1 hypothetical protein [Rhizobium leguminosarum]